MINALPSSQYTPTLDNDYSQRTFRSMMGISMRGCADRFRVLGAVLGV